MFRLHALGAAAGQSTSGGAPGPETNEGGKGGHGGTTSVTGNGPTTRGCRTAERRMAGHCAAPRARHRGGARGGGSARAAAQSPITKKPANTRPNRTMQAAARKHAVDMGHLGPKNVGGVEIRGAPEAGSVPRTRLRLPRTGRRDRDARGAVLIFLHATSRGRGRRERRRTPRTRIHRLAPSTAPSRATRRTAGDRARRVGRSPVPARHTRVRDPPYRYKPHVSSRREKTRRLP